jgi:hypothetical protein
MAVKVGLGVGAACVAVGIIGSLTGIVVEGCWGDPLPEDYFKQGVKAVTYLGIFGTLFGGCIGGAIGE